MTKKTVTPKSTPVLDFPGALKLVRAGHSISKREWGNPALRVLLFENKLVIQKEDGIYYPLIVTDGDLFGKDWYVV